MNKFEVIQVKEFNGMAEVDDEIEQENSENTQYELLSREIYRQLLKSEGYENIDVQHNVKIEGKSGCKHQIDVYWEFKLGGENHRVAIECKNFTKEVSIAKVRDFFGVVYDIGNIKGLFVTKKGFQSGAKKFAGYHGIGLKEIRLPQAKDWEGRLKTIDIEIHVLPVEVKNIRANIDINWIISRGLIKSEAESNKIKLTKGMNNEVFVYDGRGEKISSFLELQEGLPHNMEKGSNLTHSYSFPDAYLESSLGKVKVNSIDFVYDITSVSDEIKLEADEIVKAILKDVKSGEIKFFNKDGSIR